MDSGKIDNQLSLALNATNRERGKTLDLEVGFEPEEKRWELIINLTTIHESSCLFFSIVCFYS